MKLQVKLDKGAYMPTRAHDDDAGWDIRTPKDLLLTDKATIDTGVHILIPKGYVGMLKAKSGLNVKYDIVGEGVIDAGYTGSIVVKLYCLQVGRGYYFRKGDKIIQLVVIPIPDTEMEVVNFFVETERGNNGFGSSGR